MLVSFVDCWVWGYGFLCCCWLGCVAVLLSCYLFWVVLFPSWFCEVVCGGLLFVGFSWIVVGLLLLVLFDWVCYWVIV